MTLALAMTAWRQEWDLTQVEAAELLGVSRSTLSLWESGNIPHPRLVRLAYERLDDKLRAERQVEWNAAHNSSFSAEWRDKVEV
jgi:transcriptional regulator with XRE-family HTH domain